MSDIITYDGTIFPFNDKDFDGIVSFQAIYQSDNINLTISEMNRVLRPNGKILVSVPFIWFDSCTHMESRFCDYYIRQIFDKNGFKVEKIIKTNANISALFLLANIYANGYVCNIKNKFFVRLLKVTTSPFVFFLNLAGLMSLKFLPKTENLYIDAVILGKKTSDIR